MIKSDKWIKQQCTYPSFMVTHLVPQAQNPNGMGGYYLPRKTEYMSNRSEESLKQAITDSQYSDSGIKAYRPLTAEELATYVPMISPFTPGQIRTEEVKTVGLSATEIATKKILSYGTSSFGYDVTLSDEFRIFTNMNSTVIDPLNFDENCLHPFKGDVCIIPPNSYILGVTREKFVIPRDVMVVCVGKSTYARCGAIINVTPIEPGFEGAVVIEISNATNLPMKIYANQGVAQFLFFQSNEECETSYKDKGGKYQGQTGMTLAKV